MRGSLIAVALAVLAVAARAQNIDHVGVSVTGGRSVATWHGQADLQAINIELARALSPRTDVAFVAAAMDFWQPRSWFGSEFGDGDEHVRAISGSLLVRRALGPFYLEGSTGPMFAEKRVPASTSRFNFVSQFGAGLVLMRNARVPLLLGYRFVHVSNGGYAPRNPGLNISAITIGARLGNATRR
jgi:hypothetical protein